MREGERVNQDLCAEQQRLLRLELRESEAVINRRLHSKYDPWKEAAGQIAGKSNPERTIVVFGAGLGYTVVLLLREGRNVVWCEPDHGILRTALGTNDFRPWIGSGRLRILTSVDSDAIEALGLRPEEVQYFSHRAFHTDELAHMRSQLDFLLNRKSVNQATLARFEKLWAVNLCGNLAAWRNGIPVRTLFGQYQGRPALVVGAGPSLEDVVQEIKRKQESVVVIAVDTAVRILGHAGVDPDFIVTVDPQPVNRVFLESYRGRATVVVDPTVSYHSGRHIAQMNVAVAATPFVLGRLFAAGLGGPPGEIAYGGSVSTNAYDLARKLGCDPVYLAGQDLAFSDGQVHARGASLEERLSWKENRLWRREMHNFAQRTAIPPLAVEDIRGGISPTNGKLAIFHAWFENRIKKDRDSGLRTVNCTTRGALLRAAENGRISDIPERTFAKIRATSRKVQSVLPLLERLRDSVREVNEGYERAFSPGSEMKRLRELDLLGRQLRKSEALEAIGNAAQKAIRDVIELNEGDVERLHRELHASAKLLERLLARTARIIRDRQEQDSSTDSPQIPGR